MSVADAEDWGSAGAVATSLTPAFEPGKERRFREWYAKRAKARRLDENPDAPEHHYDYRRAFDAGAEPDETGHWPSDFKLADHPNRYVGGVDTITGASAADDWGGADAGASVQSTGQPGRKKKTKAEVYRQSAEEAKKIGRTRGPGLLEPAVRGAGRAVEGAFHAVGDVIGSPEMAARYFTDPEMLVPYEDWGAARDRGTRSGRDLRNMGPRPLPMQEHSVKRMVESPITEGAMGLGMAPLEVLGQTGLGALQGNVQGGFEAGMARAGQSGATGALRAAASIPGLDLGFTPEEAEEAGQHAYFGAMPDAAPGVGNVPSAGASLANRMGWDPRTGQAADTLASAALPLAHLGAGLGKAARAVDAARDHARQMAALDELAAGEQGAGPSPAPIPAPEPPEMPGNRTLGPQGLEQPAPLPELPPGPAPPLETGQTMPRPPARWPWEGPVEMQPTEGAWQAPEEMAAMGELAAAGVPEGGLPEPAPRGGPEMPLPGRQGPPLPDLTAAGNLTRDAELRQAVDLGPELLDREAGTSEQLPPPPLDPAAYGAAELPPPPGRASFPRVSLEPTFPEAPHEGPVQVGEHATRHGGTAPIVEEYRRVDPAGGEEIALHDDVRAELVKNEDGTYGVTRLDKKPGAKGKAASFPVLEAARAAAQERGGVLQSTHQISVGGITAFEHQVKAGRMTWDPELRLYRDLQAGETPRSGFDPGLHELEQVAVTNPEGLPEGLTPGEATLRLREKLSRGGRGAGPDDVRSPGGPAGAGAGEGAGAAGDRGAAGPGQPGVAGVGVPPRPVGPPGGSALGAGAEAGGRQGVASATTRDAADWEPSTPPQAERLSPDRIDELLLSPEELARGRAAAAVEYDPATFADRVPINDIDPPVLEKARKRARGKRTAKLLGDAIGLTAEGKLGEKGAVGKKVYSAAEQAEMEAGRQAAWEELRRRYPTVDELAAAVRRANPKMTAKAARAAAEKVFASTVRPGGSPTNPPEGMPPQSTGPLPTRAAGSLLSKLADTGDLQRVIADTAEARDQYRAARRDPQSTGGPGVPVQEVMANAIGIARDLGVDPVKLASFAEEAPEKVWLLGQLSRESAAEFSAARDAWKATPNEATLARLGVAMVDHAAVAEQALRVRSEMGRSMRMMQEVHGALAQGSKLSDVLKKMGGRLKVEGLAQLLETLPEDQRPAFLRKGMKPATTMDKIFELWVNSILSNPKTHAANFLSNAAMNAYVQTLEHGAAAAMPWSEVTFKEVVQRQAALKRAGAYAAKLASEAWRLETEQLGGKWEVDNPRAIGGPAGKFLRAPTRLLGASDAAFKGLAYVQELEGLAVRDGLRKGLDGDALQRYVDQVRTDAIDGDRKLVDRNGDSFAEQADRAAHELTFTQDSPLARGLHRAAAAIPGGRYIIPFTRTPVNIAKAALHRSPGALATAEFRAAWRKGGAARDLAVARVGLGSTIMGAVAAYALDGTITGQGPQGPGKRDQRAALYASGWMPYAVKLGDRYYSYSRLEPFATMAGIAADGAETARDYGMNEDLWTVGHRIALASANQLGGKTYLSGAGNLLEAIQEGDPNFLKRAEQQTIAGLVPFSGLTKGIADQMDPVLREERSVMDAVLAKLPLGKGRLIPKRDRVTGDQVEREWVGLDILSPLQASQVKDDPVAQELARLKMGVARVPDKVKLADGTVRKLSDQEWDQLAMETGRYQHDKMLDLVTDPAWEEKEDGAKANALRGVIRTARDVARRHLAGQAGFEVKGGELSGQQQEDVESLAATGP